MASAKTTALIVFCALLIAGCAAEKKEPSVAANSAHRVVTLAPSLTEIVCAVGGTEVLAGRTSACDYPTVIKKTVPVIGQFGKPDLERLVSLSPTLVLDVALADEAEGVQMKKLGLKRERIRCENMNDICEAIVRVGELLEREEKAKEIASELWKGIEKLRKDSASITNRPRVYVETWSDPLWTAGKDTFISELISLAGGVNIGDDVNKEHFQVDHEWVVSRNPDIILCLYMAEDVPARTAMMKRAGGQKTNAIKNKKVYDHFDNNIILRPGPRVLEGVKAVKECLADAE
ncbi:hypothetical protein BVX94_02985 [bacterium B17]|nr:hypothetical protein BVX94_02985 [bacterium B17]